MARKPISVLVRVPASTSNLGSGFDTLGLAENLYNNVSVTPLATKKGVAIVSRVAGEDRAAAEAMVTEAADEFFRRAGIAAFGITVSLEGNVPVARGLGYSATARLGGVAALNEIT